MTHPDPDLLALLALGEPAGTPEEREHVARCPECGRRLDEFTTAVAAGRAARSPEPLEQPSDRVWAGISATLGLSPDVHPEALGYLPDVHAATDSPPAAGPVTGPRTGPAAGSGIAERPGPAPESPAATAALAPVVPLAPSRSRRSRRGAWLAVAAGLVVVGGVGTAVVLGSQGPGQGAVVAEATLDALPDWPDATGSAVVRETGGERILDVSVTPDSRPDAVREVWLISADLTKLVSVGLLATDEGTFALPQGIDLSEYPVVDVSSEPLDGNPAHSADSIVRGALRSA